MSTTNYVAVNAQYFSCHQDWVNRASRVLTSHPQYLNAEHSDKKGWRGAHFTALCFDQKGRRCRNGADFSRAEADGSFPIWWVWPDQIADLLMGAAIAPELAASGLSP